MYRKIGEVEKLNLKIAFLLIFLLINRNFMNLKTLQSVTFYKNDNRFQMKAVVKENFKCNCIKVSIVRNVIQNLAKKFD